MQILKTDVAIYGGGVAGLWIANHLNSLGINFLLFEPNSIGGGQTINSQGIIHHGGKYIGEKEKSFGYSTESWRAALSGKGPVNLSNVKVLTKQQYLWMTNRFINKNGHLLRTALAIKGIDYSRFSKNVKLISGLPDFDQEAVLLGEPVLSVPSLLAALSEPIQEKFMKGSLQGFEASAHKNKKNAIVNIDGQSYSIDASSHICAMGANNAQYAKNLNINSVETRYRPLKQIVLSGDLPEFYGIGLSAMFHPTIAIVSHPQPEIGKNSWYIGGHLSDGKNSEKANDEITSDLSKILRKNGFDLSSFKYSTHTNYAIRAEASMKNRKSSFRTPVICNSENIYLVWPNKLTNAPVLSSQLIQILEKQGMSRLSSYSDTSSISKPSLCLNVPWLQPTSN